MAEKATCGRLRVLADRTRLRPRHKSTSLKVVKREDAIQHWYPGVSLQVSSELGTHRTVRTRIWSWLAGQTPCNLQVVFFLLGSGRKHDAKSASSLRSEFARGVSGFWFLEGTPRAVYGLLRGGVTGYGVRCRAKMQHHKWFKRLCPKMAQTKAIFWP